MATTRKPRQRKAKEEVVKVEKKVEVFPEVLNSEHLLALETMSRDLENAKLLMALEEQSLANMELKLKILSDSIIKQRAVVREKAERYEGEKKKYTSYKKQIWPLYGFKEEEGLGYDPLTGNIVRT
jgi:hypothetical protein